MAARRSRAAELHPTKTPGWNFWQMIAVPEAFFDAAAEMDEETLKVSLDLMRRLFGNTIIDGDMKLFREALAQAGIDPEIDAEWTYQTDLGQGEPEQPEDFVSGSYGSSPGRLRKIERIVARDGLLCGLCGDELDVEIAVIDHHIPKALGGHSRLGNLQLAHTECNRRKGPRLAPRVLSIPLESVVST